MATDTKLQELVINTMTKAQYDALATKDPNEIYVATDAKTGAQDLDTTNDGAAGQVLTKTDGGMEWADAAAGDSLPEQTGHTGFLQTDGTNATWSDVAPVSSKTEFRAFCSTGGSYTLSESLICLRAVSGTIGPSVIRSNYGFTIGGGETYVFGNASGAIHLLNRLRIDSDRTLVIGIDGDFTAINAPNSILMGTESRKYYKVLDGLTGFIPPERLAAAGTKEIMATASMPSVAYTDLTLGASGSTYTAPADGWFSCSSEGVVNILLTNQEFSLTITGTSEYAPFGYMPVKKGEKFVFSYSSNQNNKIRFYYAEGAKHLA